MLHIDITERADLSGEIYRQVRRAIVEKRLRPGDRLPSTRELARTIAVARATVVIAYERLAGEGFIESLQGAGTFVSDWSDVASTVGVERNRSALTPLSIWSSISLPTVYDIEPKFNFRTGTPDGSLFPHRHWRRLVVQVLRETEAMPHSRYGNSAGHLPLRAAIARHIGVSRGIKAAADDIIITNGTQQAVDLLARVLLASGDRIAVEDPGYEAPRRAFQIAGAEIVNVPVDCEGLVVDAIPGNVKAVYVTPSHQYPLTSTMSLRRRRALLAWAEEHEAAIIEDDYDGEFRFEGRPLDPLQTLDTGGRVIYVGSFSKTMQPGLRLGFVISPPGLSAALTKAKFVSDWASSTLEQTALARFIDDGSFARHVRKMGLIYAARQKDVAKAIIHDFADHLELIPSTTGLHLAALARSASIAEVGQVTARAATMGVQVHCMACFPVGGTPRAGLVIGYSAISTDRIGEGLQRLRSCFAN